MDNMQTMDMEYKPWGGLAGVYSGIEQAQAQQSNENKLVGQGLENTIKGVEAGRAMSDYADPNMEYWRQQGIMGKNKSADATGQFDQATLQSKIKDQLAEYASKVPKHQLEKEISESQLALTMLHKVAAFGEKTGYNGLEFVNSAMKVAQENNIDPQMIQMFAKANPEQRKQLLSGLMQSHSSIVELAPKYLQDKSLEGVKHTNTMAQNAAKDAAHMERTRVTEAGATARNAASIASQKETNIEAQKTREQQNHIRAAAELDAWDKAASTEILKLEEAQRELLAGVSNNPKNAEAVKKRNEIKAEYDGRIKAIQAQREEVKARLKHHRDAAYGNGKAPELPAITEPVPDKAPPGKVRRVERRSQ